MTLTDLLFLRATILFLLPLIFGGESTLLSTSPFSFGIGHIIVLCHVIEVQHYDLAFLRGQ